MEESEEYIETITQSIKEEYEKAKSKADFDAILKKYNIKIKKKNKIVSSLYVSLYAKRAIIRMAFCEYGDIFDYDVFMKKTKDIIRNKKK